MFRQSLVKESDGCILVELQQGSETRSLAILTKQKVIKITAPNLKAAVDLDRVNAFFSSKDGKTGVLTVSFLIKPRGIDERSIEMGTIDSKSWELISSHIGGTSMVMGAAWGKIFQQDLKKGGILRNLLDSEKLKL